MAWDYADDVLRGMLGELAPKGSMADLMADGKIDIYTGGRPASANDALTGSETLLCTLTLDGGAYTPGSPGPAVNGLSLALDGATLILKRASGEIWKGAGLTAAAAGTVATWCRWTANNTGTEMVIDGTVGTSGADLNMTNGTTVVDGVDVTVSDVTIDLTSA